MSKIQLSVKQSQVLVFYSRIYWAFVSVKKKKKNNNNNNNKKTKNRHIVAVEARLSICRFEY